MSNAEDLPGLPAITPAYTGALETTPIPNLRMPATGAPPTDAYRFIRDELLFDGSSKLNLATFVSTWMDPQARLLMAQTFDKNMIEAGIALG